MSRTAFGVLCLLVCIAAIGVGCAQQYSIALPARVSPAGLSLPTIAPAYGAGPASAGFQAAGAETLSDAEQSDVLLAQDYQRLEADLYTAFATQNPNEPLFSTMGQSASVLVTAGDAVIGRYQLQYPGMSPPGSYSDPQVSVLYATLVGSGGGAVTDALRASATSEEYHLSALGAAENRTSNPDLVFFYNQELAAARDNLRSSVQRLAQFGVTYTPQYLPGDVYTAIIGGQAETVQPLPTGTPAPVAPYNQYGDMGMMSTPAPASGSASYSGPGPAARPASFQEYRTGSDIAAAQDTDLMRAEDYERMISDLNYAFSANYPAEPLFLAIRQTAESLATAGESILAAAGITDLGRGPAGAYSSYEVTGLWGTHFPNPDLPVSDALRFDAEIEEHHIAALNAALGRTSDTSVQAFYNEGLAGARNNLRDTVARLSDYGVTYTPELLSQQDYAAILSAPREVLPNLPAVSLPAPAQLPAAVPTPAPIPPSSSGGSYAGVGNPEINGIIVQFQAIPASPLTDAEMNDILSLQQSQKLQRDLYLYMAQQSRGNPLFTGLAQSADAVLSADNIILAKYNLTLPTGNAPATYSDPALQERYIYLTGQSGGTTPDQLTTAAMSEEIHIIELTTALGRADNADLRYIYNQELALSRNNLRTIVPQLAAFGTTYVPQYLTQDEFNAIVSGPMETVPHTM